MDPENMIENNAVKEKETLSVTTEPAPEEQIGPESAFLDIADGGKAKKRRRRVRWIIVTAVILIFAVLFVVNRIRSNRNVVADTSWYTTYSAERRDLTVTLSGSGTLKPADSYTITTLTSGDILSAPFEEGDIVNKGDVLYVLDSSDVANSIEQAENTLADSRKNYQRQKDLLKDLNIKANGAGTVTELYVEVGDTVQAGEAIALVRNSQTMSLTLQFLSGSVSNFYVGQNATVMLGGSANTFEAVVSEIGTVDIVLSGRSIVREVTVDIQNPGALSPVDVGSAAIAGISPVNEANFEYKYEGTVTATVSGEVASINAPKGSNVDKNQVIVKLSSDTLDQQIENAASSVKDAELALENQRNKLEDYTIKSPISGTIIEKEYKEGDALESGEVLCTIFDLSFLELTLKVDELDINQVKPGQLVTITADSVEGKTFQGTVTKVNINGTTTNGVTSYPVTVRIEASDGLLPGMNVDAVVTLESMTDVLTVPIGAVTRNNIVLVQTDAGAPGDPAAGIPAGFEQKEVTVGPSNDEYIVITGGLEEGDVVAVIDNTPSGYYSDPFAPGNGGRSQAAQAAPEPETEGAAE
jgi:HlyD family secretion protein